MILDFGNWFLLGSLDSSFKERKLVFTRIIGLVFLDLWTFGLIRNQSTSDTKVHSSAIPDNGSNALIFAYGFYLVGSRVAVNA